MTVSADKPTGRNVIGSLVRGLDVIQAFGQDHPAMTLDETAARCGISRSATRRLLKTLQARGYVRFDGRLFRLTPHLLELGYVQQSQQTIAEVARPHAEKLSRLLDRNVSVAVLAGLDAQFVLRVEAKRLMRISLGVGSRVPAHLTALGTVLLAGLPDDELENYLAHAQFPEQTPHSIRSAKVLRDDLRRISDNGWATSEQQLEEGLSAVAVPIVNRHGSMVAAINASSQAVGQAQMDAEVASVLKSLWAAADEIGSDLHVAHQP